MELERELDIIEKHIRQDGYRWTSQRRLIAKVALENHSHFSAEELLELCQAQDAGVSRATVYRTLAMMEEAGFVDSLNTGDGGRKYEHTLGHEHHDHMVCTECGIILEFHDEELEQRQEVAAQERGFTIKSHSLKLFGSCKACSQKAEGDSSSNLS